MEIISIIVPVYKVEEYLDRCIQSIINQTYRNLEIILVDDGSPDRCGEICDEYVKKDPRIKVIHKENGGLSDARNAGIDIATGDYIGFVDSDDFIHPEMYAILLENLEIQNADIAICGQKRTYIQMPYPSISEYLTTTYSNTGALKMLHSVICTDFALAWNKLYKRTLFNDIRYPKGKIHEDEFTTYKLLYSASRVVYIKLDLYYYYQSPNSIIRSQFNEKRLDYAEAMEERLAFFKNKQLVELYLFDLKRHCLWLLSFYYTHHTFIRSNTKIKKIIAAKLEKCTQLLFSESEQPNYLRLTFAFARKCPYFAGFFAFHRLFRKNIISPISVFLFNSPYP